MTGGCTGRKAREVSQCGGPGGVMVGSVSSLLLRTFARAISLVSTGAGYSPCT